MRQYSEPLTRYVELTAQILKVNHGRKRQPTDPGT